MSVAGTTNAEAWYLQLPSFQGIESTRPKRGGNKNYDAREGITLKQMDRVQE